MASIAPRSARRRLVTMNWTPRRRPPANLLRRRCEFCTGELVDAAVAQCGGSPEYEPFSICRRLDEARSDIMMSDIVLPAGSGLEIARRVHAMPRPP